MTSQGDAIVGSGELVVESLDELGLKRDDAVIAAMFYLADEIGELGKRMNDFVARRAMVEGLVEDMAALVAHQANAKRPSDKQSVVGYTAGELLEFAAKADVVLSMYDKLPRRRISGPTMAPLTVALAMRVTLRVIRANCSGLDVNGSVTDDNDEHLVGLVGAATRALFRLEWTMRRHRSDWAKETLGKNAGPIMETLAKARKERLAELEEVMNAVREGRMSREEGAKEQYQILMKKTTIDLEPSQPKAAEEGTPEA